MSGELEGWNGGIIRDSCDQFLQMSIRALFN